MFILCDTCSVLMLIRIEPSMLLDKRYECLITTSVYNEIVRTSKFKNKYQWRKDIKDKLKTFPLSEQESEEYKLYLAAINKHHEFGVINKKTKRYFSLSRTDREIISCALTHEFLLSSSDNDLVVFAFQEFNKVFKGVITPLGVLNKWLSNGLIKWDTKKQKYLSEWSLNNESPQPQKEKKKFQSLTGFKYTGT